jgi:WD40 repeat protein
MPTPRSSEYDVFLSHNSIDKPIVEELARRLTQAGIEPFLDKWNLIPGQPWQEALEEALSKSAACAVLIGGGPFGPWHHEEMRAALAHRISGSRGKFPVIPVLLPETERPHDRDLPMFLKRMTWVEFSKSLDDEAALHRLVCGIRGLAPGPGPGQAVFAGECPYRGLEVFEEKDARFFFGREAQVDWLVSHRLAPMAGSSRATRFLAVLGPSGSGKSSLALAGLVPALRAGKVEGSATWPIAVFRPGYDPFENLTFELSKLNDLAGSGPALLARTCEYLRVRSFADDSRALHFFARYAFDGAPAARRLIMLVDQFEEVFTLCPAEREQTRRAFIDTLLHAASVVGGQVVVLLTMRADFLGKCASYPALAAALSDGQELVGPMQEDELRLTIERPAYLVDRELEPGLADMLLLDVAGQPGALPLLQYTLFDLWRRNTRRLTVATYREIGGVQGSLERRADEVVNTLSDTEREICRRLFLRLTQPGEGTEDTKRRAPLRELLDSANSQKALEEVIRRMADARLITTHGRAGSTREKGDRAEDSYVEVAHEALIRVWGRLRKWIDGDRAGLRIHRRLTESAREWEEKGRPRDDYIETGTRLAVAREWAHSHRADLSILERAFLAESLRAERRIKSDKLAAARRLAEEAEARRRAEEERARLAELREREARVLAEVARKSEEKAVIQAQIAERHARIAKSRQLAVMAVAELGRRYDLALLLSVKALQFSDPTDDTFEARHALCTALNARPGLIALLHHDRGILANVAFSPDGTTLAARYNHEVILFDVATRRPLGDPLLVPEGYAAIVAFSSDGKTLAAGHQGGDHGEVFGAVLYDLVARRRLGDPLSVTVPDGKCVWSKAFSSDARTVAAGFGTYGFGPPGGGVILYEVAGRRPLSDALEVREGNVGSVAFSPDGKTMAVGYSDNSDSGGVVLYDLARRRRLGAPLPVREGLAVNGLAFSPDGKTLAASYSGKGGAGGVTLHSVPKRRRLGNPLVIPEGSVAGVAFSPDGKALAAGYAGRHDGGVLGGGVVLFDAGGRHRFEVREGDVGSVAFSSDGKTLAAHYGGGVILYDVSGHHHLADSVMVGERNMVESVAFSPDGQTLAAGCGRSGPDGSGRVILYDASSRRLREALVVPEGRVKGVAFSPDGKVLATGYGVIRASYTGGVIQYDVAASRRLGDPLEVPEGCVASVAFSPDGTTLAAGYLRGGVGGVILCDAATHRRLGDPLDEVHEANIVSVAFSPDGTTLAVGYESGFTGGVILHDATTRRRLGDPLEVREGQVTSVAFSPGGTTVAVGYQSSGGGVIHYDVTLRRRLGDPLEVPEGQVTSVAFSPDGRTLAAGFSRGLILFDVGMRRRLGEPLTVSGESIKSLAFSPDGKTLAAGWKGFAEGGELGGGLILYDVALESWQHRACRIANRNLSRDEWTRFIGQDVPYQSICLEFPVPAERSASDAASKDPTDSVDPAPPDRT